MFYVDVVFPLALPRLYTYSAFKEIAEGCRVVVQLGKKKFYSAIVVRCYNVDEEKNGIKEIVTLLDETPIVLPRQIELWKWISDYYMCTLGEVMKAALPSALKLESETKVSLLPDAVSEKKLSPAETKIFDLLSDGKNYSIQEINKSLGIANAITLIRTLIEKGILTTDERLSRNFVPKSETYVTLTEYAVSHIHQELDLLWRARRQQTLLSVFLSICGNNDLDRFSLPAKDLLAEANASPSLLKGLVEKGIFSLFQQEVSQSASGLALFPASKLSDPQENAYKQIEESFNEKNVVLLHGVTSSGKTEVYIHLITKELAKGKQVLYLLPEIALTTQITERLRSVFGDKLGVYHSKFSDNDRAELWNNLIKRKGIQVVLGVRSSVFLPFDNLGLVIVDEEHESSYKQQDPAPRYHARNAAIVLASKFGAKILLGTATPSVETYFNALSGKYGLVELKDRFEGVDLPRIEVVNTKELKRKKIMKSRIFSPFLVNRMKEAFDKDNQVILFRNRRGFAPYLECKACGWIPKCQHCDVSLTYHKYSNSLSCHYCGASYSLLSVCESCGNENSLELIGYGTEQVEEEILEIFPDKKIGRMDLDTTRSRKAYERILTEFAHKQTDILVGTQMVSKGLDFENVSLVGIVGADGLLNQPDFRAHERAFQMLEQVSGRAGRKNSQGLVVLQTSNPEHPIIDLVCSHDYISFYNKEIVERKLFKYPPFFRLFQLVIKGRDKQNTHLASTSLAQLLRVSFGERVQGPVEPLISRAKTLYIRKILLKVETNIFSSQSRHLLNHVLTEFSKQKIASSVMVYVDVDPY